MFATSRVQPTEASLPAANGQVTGADAQPAKKFTDAAVSPAPPAPAPPPPDAARTAVAEPVRTPPPAPPVAKSTPSPRETASLLIRSSPSGAVVTVDGTARGTTPLTLRDVALGTRTIVLSRPGVRVERAPGHAHGRSAITFTRGAALTDLCPGVFAIVARNEAGVPHDR